jgi:hypothetical protein
MTSLVGIVTGREDRYLRYRGSIPGRGKKCISSLRCPDQVWNTSSLIFNGFRDSSRGKEVGLYS